MRCFCCNRVLNDFEATRKSATTGDYLDTCNKCIKGLNIKTIDREDLAPKEEVDDEFEIADTVDDDDEPLYTS